MEMKTESMEFTPSLCQDVWEHCKGSDEAGVQSRLPPCILEHLGDYFEKTRGAKVGWSYELLSRQTSKYISTVSDRIKNFLHFTGPKPHHSLR